MANVPLSKGVPQIYVPSLSAPQIYVPQIKPPQIDVPGKITARPPKLYQRHAKDLGDIILGNPVTGTRELRETLMDYDLTGLIGIPIINRIAGAAIMGYERELKPITEGKYGVAAINALETVGNSLDIVANPVKSLLPWAGGGTPTDLFKSMGWIEDEYRKTYQWDTGNFVVDLLGEVVSDPVNWFTFGSKALASTTLDELAPAYRKAISKVYGKEIAENITDKQIKRIIIDTGGHIVKDNKKILRELNEQLNKNLDLISENIKRFAKDSIEYKHLLKAQSDLNFFLKHIDEVTAQTALNMRSKAMLYELNLMKQHKLYKAYEAYNLTKAQAKAFDKGLTRVALGMSPVAGSSALLYNKVISPTFKALWNTAATKLKGVNLNKAFNNQTGDLVALQETIAAKSKAINKPVFDKFDALFQKYNINVDKLNKLYEQILDSLPAFKQTEEEANKIFLKKLMYLMPELKELTPNNVLSSSLSPNKIMVAKALSQQDLDNLVVAISEAGTVLHYAELSSMRTFKNLLEKDMMSFYDEPHAKALGQYGVIKRIKYIDQRLLPLQGKGYSIATLKETLTELNKKDPKQYAYIAALLDYVGVNLHNHKYVMNLIKRVDAGDKKAIPVLKTLVSKSRRGVLLDVEEIERSHKTIRKYLHQTLPKPRLTKDINTRNMIDFFEKAGAESKAANVGYIEFATAVDKSVKNVIDIHNDLTKNIEDIRTLQDTLYNLDPHFKFWSALEPADTYDGSNETLSEILETIISDPAFNIEAGATPNIEDVKAFVDNLEHLKKTVRYWSEVIKSGRLNLNRLSESEHTAFELFKNKIYDVDILLNKPQTKVIVNDFKNIYDSCSKLYTLKVSQEGMFEMMELNLLANTPDKWLKQISRIGSPTREKLYEVCVALRTHSKEGESLANAIKQILATIDSTNALYVLLGRADTLSSMDIPEEQLRFIRGMLFNIIYKNKDIYADAALNDITKYVDEFMSGFRGHNKRALTEYFQKEFAKNADYNNKYIMSQRMQELVDSIKLGDASDEVTEEYVRLKELGITPDMPAPRFYTAEEQYVVFEQELRDSVEHALNEYFETITKLSEYNDFDAHIGTFFTDSTVRKMNQLGDDFGDLIKILTEEKVDAKALDVVTEFAVRTSGNTIIADTDELKHLLHKLIPETMAVDEALQTSKKMFIESADEDIHNINSMAKYIQRAGKRVDRAMESYDVLLEQKLRELSMNSMARSITQTFTDVGKLNAKYSGSDVDLAEIFNKWGTKTKVRNLFNLVTAEEFNDYVKAVSSYNNSYGWSTANNFLAVKQIVDPRFLATHHIAPNDLKPLFDYLVTNCNVDPSDTNINRLYAIFYAIYTDAYSRFKDIAITNKERMEYTRKALSARFGEKLVMRLNDAELLSLEAVARNPKFNKDMAKFYSSSKRNYATATALEHRLDSVETAVADYINAESKLTNNVVIDDDAWGEYFERMLDSGYDENILYGTVRKDLSGYLKDPESLQHYKADFERYVRDDIQALENTKIFTALARDRNTIKEYLVDHSATTYHKLRTYGIKADTKASDPKVLKLLREERALGLEGTIRSLNAKQLRKYIEKNTAGVLFFVDADSIAPFKFTPEELKAAGLKIKCLKGDTDIYIVRGVGKATEEMMEDFTYITPKSFFPELQEKITRGFKLNRNYFYWDGMDLPDELFTGEMMDKEVYEAILSDKRLKEFLGDIAEQKTYSKLDAFGNNTFFTKKISRPNMVIVGGRYAYNDTLDAFTDALKSKNVYPYYLSGRIDKMAVQGSISAIKRVNTEHKYLQLFFNDDYYLDAPMFNTLFRGCTDVQIQDIFKRNNFDACILRQDRKGRPTIYKIHIANKQQLEAAKEAKAILVPHEVYRNMVLSINKHTLNSKFLNAYKQLIVSTFKTIYLTSPGFLMRNALDSMLYKNAATRDGLSDIVSNFKYEYRASKLLAKYDEVVKRAIELSSKNGQPRTFNRYYLKRAMADLTDEEKMMFRLTDVFMNSSASAGLTESLQSFLLDFNMRDTILDETVWETWYKQYVLNNPVVDYVQGINDHIEKSARFGLFLGLVDNGATASDAIRQVINTHFDYELKEVGMRTLEQIFWFSTFPINNMFYYINEGLTKSPDMFKAQMAALRLSWNDGEDFTWDDVKKSKYLTYNALTGNIRFELRGNQIVLKTGSSVMDFFNLLYNPVGEARDRLNPFLSVLFGFEGPDQLNPLGSVTNKVSQIKRGQSYLPSVYTKLYPRYKRLHKIERAPYIPKTWGKSSRRRKPHFKNPSSLRRLNYIFSTDRYYFGRGKNKHRWLSATTSIEPHWYMNNYRHYKSGRNYKSLLRAKHR